MSGEDGDGVREDGHDNGGHDHTSASGQALAVASSIDTAFLLAKLPARCW